MQRLAMLWRYLQFYLGTTPSRKISHPFVQQFCKEVLEDQRWFYAFSMIEPIRQAMLQNHHEITVTDLGAGSKVQKGRKRKVSKIAASAVSPPFQCRLLFRIVNYFKPSTLLEMGTSLGISGMYQAMARQNAHFISLEGCSNIAHIAGKNIKALKLQQLQLMTGAFEQTLPQALQQLKKLDYAFIDGNHQKAATLAYFEQCLSYAHEQSIFVFDDIYWSDEMSEAWEAIKKHPQVSLSIDLYFMGLVFFRKDLEEKAHYQLRLGGWKF